MIYSNKVLEIVEKERGRFVELSNLYGVQRLVPIENVSKKMFFLNNSINSTLDVVKAGKGIKIQTTKDKNKLFLILDTQEYKIFKRDAEIKCFDLDYLSGKSSKPKNNFKVINDIKLSNRMGTCKWSITTLEALSLNPNSIIRLTLTSGRPEYVLCINNLVRLFTSVKSLLTFLEKNHIKIDIEKLIA